MAGLRIFILSIILVYSGVAWAFEPCQLSLESPNGSAFFEGAYIPELPNRPPNRGAPIGFSPVLHCLSQNVHPRPAMEASTAESAGSFKKGGFLKGTPSLESIAPADTEEVCRSVLPSRLFAFDSFSEQPSLRNLLSVLQI